MIRSALALKLHCFEDTGAIVAAMTTSIPEAPGSGRTWDYRYCWLRDAYYALAAFRLLGHFEEREQFIRYLLNIAANASRPRSRAALSRRRAHGPRRASCSTTGRATRARARCASATRAASHAQHDIFGEMVLALAPLFLDERFRGGALRPHARPHVPPRAQGRGGGGHAGRRHLGVPGRSGTRRRSRASCAGPPPIAWPASPRGTGRRRRASSAPRQTASTRRSWRRRGTPSSAPSSRRTAARSSTRRCSSSPSLRFLPADDPRLAQTIEVVRRELSLGGWLKRYKGDPMGHMEVAFTLCTFWLVEALARTGDKVARRRPSSARSRACRRWASCPRTSIR